MNDSDHNGEGSSSNRPPAIDVRGLHKNYGKGSSAIHVLQNLQMQVPQGVM